MKTRPISPREVWTDEALMLSLVNGNLEACAILFERYHLAIYNFFLKQSADRMLSEDLTQNVFERLLKYAPSYQEGKAFRSWLYQIARNVYHNQLSRKNNFQNSFSETEGLEKASPDQRLEPEETEQHQLLHKALQLLPTDQRELIIFTKWQQLKLKEVAEILHISEGAVKVRLHRAIKALREAYFKLEKL